MAINSQTVKNWCEFVSCSKSFVHTLQLGKSAKTVQIFPLCSLILKYHIDPIDRSRLKKLTKSRRENWAKTAHNHSNIFNEYHSWSFVSLITLIENQYDDGSNTRENNNPMHFCLYAGLPLIAPANFS